VRVKKTLFSPVRSKRTFEDVSLQIRDLIVRGVLKPGDRLPPEAELSKQFHVGRQTIREALRILELSGFISIQKGFGGGPFVKDSTVGKATDILWHAFKMAKTSLAEVVAARLLIEKAVLNEVFDRAGKEDIKKLQENVAKAKDLIAKGQKPFDESFEFHILLAKASKNHVFVVLVEAINIIHRRLRSQKPPNFTMVREFVEKHEQILEALVEKDRRKAIRLLEEDTRQIRNSR
jgi:DNA-binding FadR family transcriptional regulator